MGEETKNSMFKSLRAQAARTGYNFASILVRTTGTSALGRNLRKAVGRSIEALPEGDRPLRTLDAARIEYHRLLRAIEVREKIYEVVMDELERLPALQITGDSVIDTKVRLAQGEEKSVFLFTCRLLEVCYGDEDEDWTRRYIYRNFARGLCDFDISLKVGSLIDEDPLPASFSALAKRARRREKRIEFTGAARHDPLP